MEDLDKHHVEGDGQDIEQEFPLLLKPSITNAIVTLQAECSASKSQHE